MSMSTEAVNTGGKNSFYYESVKNSDKTGTTESKKAESTGSDYGQTVGTPKLSEAGKKYYDQLKKKFGNMDFILVSKDMKEQAKAQAAGYANASKTVVLIDEEKIEKMATDKNFRKQYEGIINNASSGMAQLKASLNTSGATVKGFGMQVNDGGTVSLFAVLKKSSMAQKERIEKHAEQKKLEQKAAAKKAEKQEREEALHSHGTDGKTDVNEIDDDSDTVTITANSIEELLQKIQDYQFEEQSDFVQTEEEKMVGQHVDFKG